jgi:hypothetical protein
MYLIMEPKLPFYSEALYFCVLFRLSFCLSVLCISAYPSAVHLSASLAMCLSVFLSLCLSVSLSLLICLSLCLSLSLSLFDCGSSPCNRFYPPPPPPTLSNSVKNFSKSVIILLGHFYKLYKNI